MGLQRESAGLESPSRGSLSLTLYQTGILLLGVLLVGVASEKSIAPNFEKVLPLLYTLLLFWGVSQLATLSSTIRGSQRGVRLRVLVDLGFSLAIVCLTGGVVSFFLPLLFASVLASSTFLGLRQAVITTSFTSAALTLMTMSQIAGWRPAELIGAVARGVEGRTSFLITSLVGQTIAMHFMTYLGARLKGGLERAESLKSKIVEGIGDGVIAVDERRRVILINGEAERMFELDPEASYLRRSLFEAFAEPRLERLVELLESSKPGVRAIEWEKSDETLPLTLRCTEIPSASGARGLWVFIFHDRSFEKRAARAEARLRNLQALEDLALGLVHEIRNPLASIRGSVQELSTGRLSDRQRDRLSSIAIRESDRLDRIVTEFLESASTQPNRKEEFRLGECLQEVAESLRCRDDAKQVEVEVDSPETALVFGQREQIHRVFLNLGVNAVEALGGVGSLLFEVRSADEVEPSDRRIPIGDQESDMWEITVTDTGPGMDEAIRKRIFNPFFTTKTREGGLGLPLVERIVHGHGGTIEVESQPGRGTQFRVWLPKESDRHQVAREGVEERSLAI